MERVWLHQVYERRTKNHPLPQAVPSCRNAVSWDTIIAPRADLEGEKKKTSGREGEEERWTEAQPNIYSAGTNARPVHMRVMELRWRIVKWGSMMAERCPLPPHGLGM